MKEFLIVLIIVSLFIGCIKEKTMQSTDSTDSTVPQVVPAVEEKKSTMPTVKSVQEIIETYNKKAYTFGEKLDLLFQEEGNFTGSGNREILAFYQREKTVSYCSVLFK